jgi:hypothetical protein
MSAYFSINQSGLHYLISAPASCADRSFLLRLLASGDHRYASIEQLNAMCEEERKQVAQRVYGLLKRGWLQAVDKDTGIETDHHGFLQQLPELSSSGEVLLADAQGLVISSCGFARERISDLAASAARLLSVNEAARQRNMDLYNGRPWPLAMHWGELQVMAQMINLGTLKFVLVVGGDAQLENRAFSALLGQLAGRYACG